MSKLASAGEHVAGIEDLLRQILLRLPAKSLIRFKLVSKQWLSLISDPEFAQSHVLRNHSTPPSGMFVEFNPFRDFDTCEIDFFRLGGDDTQQSKPSFDFIDNVFQQIQRPFSDKGYKVSVLHSCNGLFLCCTCKYNYHLCVCNPTTKQYMFIPPIQVKEWLVSGVGFAFDPAISPHYYVICEKYSRIRTNHTWNLRIELYSSENHQWRMLHEFNEPEQSPVHVQHYDGVFCNGGIHWLGYGSFHFDLKSGSLVRRQQLPWNEVRIITTTSSIIIPNTSVGVRDKYMYIIADDRSVGVRDRYMYATSTRPKSLYVFEMSKDYSKWVVKYSLSVSDLASVYPEILTTKRFNGRNDAKFAVCAVGVVEGLKGEDAVLILAIPDKIISYNFVQQTAKTVYDFPAEPAEKFKIHAFPFVETLAPV